MEIKKIKALAEIFEKYSLTELEYAEENAKIVLKKEAKITDPKLTTFKNDNIIDEHENKNSSHDINEPLSNGVYNYADLKEIKSPLVGVFYSASSPGGKPYAEIGSKVKKGDILCIIEAMKLMNEITAEYDGEIIDICAKNAQIVEYGQTLFKLI